MNGTVHGVEHHRLIPQMLTSFIERRLVINWRVACGNNQLLVRRKVRSGSRRSRNKREWRTDCTMVRFWIRSARVDLPV